MKEFGFKFPDIRHQPKSHSMACEALRGYVCPAGFNSEGYQPFSPAGSSSPQKQILQGLRPRIWRGYSTDLYESQTLRDLIRWGLRIWQICSWDLRPCGVWFKEIFYLEGCNSLRPHMNQICWVSNTANGRSFAKNFEELPVSLKRRSLSSILCIKLALNIFWLSRAKNRGNNLGDELEAHIL